MSDARETSERGRMGERARLVALPGGRATHVRRTPLPSEVSSFVGREDELGEVVRLLQQHRLVTLTGAGGSGKTRLALAVAGDLREIFTGGPWFVELAPIADPSLVPRAVAAAIEVGERPGQPLADTLAGVLRARTALLVLDNCEHLIDSCAALTDALLRRCPSLTVLATSREPLGITGEVAWPVPPLRQAVRLFADRAQAVRPSFALTEENAPVVTRIVSEVDGLPLAVELAAARIRVLSVQEIADRLDDAMSLLVGDRRTNARHHTLAATFAWSHELLSPAEQLLFRRLAVFRGGFTLPAAEAVCAGDGLARSDVLERLTLLVEKSLVIAETTVDETRYRLLEVARQYAYEQLHRADETLTLRDRHAGYFLRLAEDADRGSTSRDEPIWFDRLAREHDNLRAAQARMLDRDEDGPEACRLAAALWPFWFIRGFPNEGIDALQAAIRRAGENDSGAKAKALNGLVVLATYQEDYDLAWAAGQEGLALYRELDDPDGIATCLTALSTTAVAGQLSTVDVPVMVAEARSLEPRLRERRVAGYLRDIEGVLALTSGDPAGAIELWQQTLVLHREVGNLIGEAFTLANLGMLYTRLGQSEPATAHLVEVLQLSSRLGYKLIIQYCFIGLGRLAADGGQPTRAARLWGAADTMTEAYGAHLTRAMRDVVDYDRALADARTRLDPGIWAQAWAEGRQLTTDQAVAYALDPMDDGPVTGGSQHLGGLTDREADVLRLVARGLTSAGVGQQLFLSPRTVDWHLSSIYSKLGVHSRTEAARFALTHGLG